MEQSDSTVVGVFGTITGALIASWAVLRGREKSSPAETQGEINNGFRAFMAESSLKIAKLEQNEKGFKQYINLLVGIMHANGIDVPPPSVIDGGFIILPPDIRRRYEDDEEIRSGNKGVRKMSEGNPGNHRSGRPSDAPNELGKLGATKGNQPDPSKEAEAGSGVPAMDNPDVNPKAPKGPPKA